MPPRVRVLFAFAPAGCSGAAAPDPETFPPANQPNFVLSLAGDQDYGDLGVFGANDFWTPRIDQTRDLGCE